MRMYAASLYVLRDGTLVCLHGSYEPDHGGLRVIFSTDGGHTWIAPAKNYGFLVSNCYGYAKAMELPDGSLFITDQDKGGHTTHDAKNMSIRCLILKIRTDHSGIDLLPAPNSTLKTVDFLKEVTTQILYFSAMKNIISTVKKMCTMRSFLKRWRVFLNEPGVIARKKT